MTHFTTDEHSNQIFTHEGWEVRIWNKTWANRIEVTAPNEEHCVDVTQAGIFVAGEDRRSGFASSFTIPWPVVAAIIEARAIVG